jgi:hypothetical protein
VARPGPARPGPAREAVHTGAGNGARVVILDDQGAWMRGNQVTEHAGARGVPGGAGRALRPRSQQHRLAAAAESIPERTGPHAELVQCHRHDDQVHRPQQVKHGR